MSLASVGPLCGILWGSLDACLCSELWLREAGVSWVLCTMTLAVLSLCPAPQEWARFLRVGPARVSSCLFSLGCDSDLELLLSHALGRAFSLFKPRVGGGCPPLSWLFENHVWCK